MLLDSTLPPFIRPKDDSYWTSRSSRSVFLVPLRDLTDPEKILFLFYLPGSGQHFFLQAQRNPDTNAAEVRIWNETARNELLVTEKGAVLVAQPTRYTFRTSLSQDLSCASGIIDCIAQVLGVRETAGQSLVDSLKEYLRGEKLLLVLDNFEHLTGAAQFIAGLLAAAPRL